MGGIEPKSMTKTEKTHWSYGWDAIKMAEQELLGYLHEYKALPYEWDCIGEAEDHRDTTRTRVTIGWMQMW